MNRMGFPRIAFARDGSGTHSLPQAAFVSGTTIESSKVNSNFSDISSALTQSLAKDGQTVPTANLPMGGFKLTGLGVGTSTTDSVPMSQLYGVPTYGGVGGGTADAITITPAPGITAYAIGQKFSFKASATNTGAVTLNVNGVGAGAVVWPYGTALAAGDITSGGMIEVEVSATTPVFHLQTPKAPVVAINQSSTGPTVQSFTSGTAATYTTPAGVKSLRVRIVGGGGGGGGIGGTTGPTGATGGTTSFNSITAVGGTGGTGHTGATLGAGGAGGTGGSGTATRFNGATGGGAIGTVGVNVPGNGGMGGGSAFFGGAGPVTLASITGAAGATNTGGGGSGASGTASTLGGGGGGGGGESAEFIINNPSATYTYTVGAGGAGGIGTGANAVTGGAGAAGFITVTENYNY